MAVTRRGVVHASFTHNAGSAKAVVAAKAGYRVLLHGLALTAASAVNATIEDSAGVNLSELIQFTASNLHFTLVPTGEPWLITPDGTGLSILLSGIVVTSGFVIYEQESIDN